MPNRSTNGSSKPATKKIPSKVCSSKSRGRVVTSPGTSEDEVRNVSSERRSSDLENSKGSTCSGDCGKIGGCGRKEKSVSLEF
ncbi:e2491239-da76-40bd-a865-c61289eb653f [Sclerotinia trifoliorum]|uniref:E2491239-da76-40bd-a865-c61289eb653f n=1 Tax=Sclerotinia trifoliorum TaxID=28548 RepID=A0A8H2VUE8_9HELO|nr:e2491239-da76-40bd-a865-c61289eb653f [Sclerotinia trifoliorum]